MDSVSIQIGQFVFDHAVYDADEDVLYLSVGIPASAGGRRRRKGTSCTSRAGRSRSSGLRSSTRGGCSNATGG